MRSMLIGFLLFTLLSYGCCQQLLSAELATNVVVDEPEPEGIEETVDNILAKRGLNASREVTKLLTNIMQANVSDKTMRSMLTALVHEFPPEQRSDFAVAASKIDGLRKKKQKLVQRVIKIFDLSEQEAKAAEISLGTKKVDEILAELQDGLESDDNKSKRLRELKHNMKGWGKQLKDTDEQVNK